MPKLRAWGHPTRFLGRSELRAMEPQLEPGEVAAACWAELDGAVEPVRAARRMLDAALALGARLVQPCEVQGLSKATGAGLRVLTNRGTWQAESVVLAAGVETERLAALVGARVALKDAPGLLVHTAPLPRLLGHVIVGEKAHFKQYPDGRLVIGDDFGPPAAHPAHGMLAGHPRDFPDDSLRAIHVRRILRQGSAYFETLAGAGVERVTIGWRPMPVDGYPVVGPLPGSPDVYAVVTHSGVTLAPLLAELVTSELLDRVDCELLHPYRPSRF